MPTAICREKKICLAWNAKCGCTHIKNIFFMLRDNLNKALIGRVHSYKTHSNGWHYPENNKLYSLIVVMRNPYFRLISGFLDKYKLKGQFRELWPKDLPCTFSNFVDLLIEKRNDIVDFLHFFPQVDTVTAFNVPHIRLEDFKEVRVMDLKNIDYEYFENKFETKLQDISAVEFRGVHAHSISKRRENKAILLPLDFIPEDIYDIPIEEFHPNQWIVPYYKFFNREIEKKVRFFFRTDFEFALRHGIDYEREFQEAKLKEDYGFKI